MKIHNARYKIADEYGMTTVVINTNIKKEIEPYIKDGLEVKNEFHMTIGPGYLGAVEINPDLDSLRDKTIKIETEKLYISENYAVLSIRKIDPSLKVVSGIPHITVALAPGAKPMRSKNLINGTEKPTEIHDLKLSLSGKIEGPKGKKKNVEPMEKKVKSPLEEKKSELNKTLFKSKALSLNDKKEISALINNAENENELEALMGRIRMSSRKRALRVAQNHLREIIPITIILEPQQEEFDAYWDSHITPLEIIRTAEEEKKTINKVIVTNPVRTTTINKGDMDERVIGNPEEYLKQMIPLYLRDIKKKYRDKNTKDPDGSKALAEAVKQATKAAMGHKGFLEEMRKEIKPGTRIVAPGAGLGHEQILAPEYVWTGLEFDPNRVDLANKQKELLGLRAKNYEWNFLKDLKNIEETMTEMGPGWEEKLNDDLIGNKHGEMPEAIYLKHACGGMTDGIMKKAIEKKIPYIFIASCCAHRYVGISHKIIAPHMTFEEYKSLTKKSQDKNHPEEAKKAVDEINELRRKYLESHGYKVRKGDTNFGPYLIAKLR